MSYKYCKIKNVDTQVRTWNGKEMAVNEVYIIPDVDRISWATNDTVIIAISDGIARIGDGDVWIEGVSNQIDYLKDY